MAAKEVADAPILATITSRQIRGVPRIEAAVRFLDAEGLPPLTAGSPHYSLDQMFA
jgi:hypothetical protein